MALTRSRTRNQTTLARLSQLLANIHGELKTIDRLLIADLLDEQGAEALRRRRAQCELERNALHRTLRQFDPELDPTRIGMSEKWLSKYATRPSSREKNYLLSLINRDRPL